MFDYVISSTESRKRIYGLRDLLEKLQEADSLNSINQTIEKNYKQTIEIKNGEQISDKLIGIENENELKDEEFLLNIHGYDSKVWEISNAKNSIWNTQQKGGKVAKLYSSKITVKPKQVTFDIDWVKEAFNELDKNYNPPDVKNNFNIKSGKILEINLADAHLNKLCFADETGTEYNHQIAKEKLIQVVHDIVDRTKDYKFEKILLPIGQDLYNIDTVSGTTTKGTAQDTSLRYKQMFNLGIEIMVYIIDHLKNVAPVEAFYVGGNHDKMLSYCLVMALYHRYINDENVNVNPSENIRQYYEFGNCLIGFAHGHDEKSRIKNLMQIEVPEMWGRTKYREMHCSHLHKEMVVDEVNGLILRRISSISGTCAWTHESGFKGAIRKAQAFIWDKEFGLTDILNSPII